MERTCSSAPRGAGAAAFYSGLAKRGRAGEEERQTLEMKRGSCGVIGGGKKLKEPSFVKISSLFIKSEAIRSIYIFLDR